MRVEAQAALANVGAAADVLIGDFGVLSASAAGGRNRLGNGTRVGAGFERQSRGLSFNVRGMWASPRFRQLGDFEPTLVDGHLPGTPPGEAGVVLRETAFGDLDGDGRAEGVAVISCTQGTTVVRTVHVYRNPLAYVARDFREQPALKIASLGYSLGLERWGYVGASLARVHAGGSSTRFNIFWTLPFGVSTSATAGAERVRGPAGTAEDERSLTLQHDLPAGEGFGWRLRGCDHGMRQAELAYQNRYGTYSAEAAQVQGTSGERVTVSGGVGAIGDTMFLSRAINDSFGMVRMRGYPDVRVYSENQEIGRTDASGILIVPRLLPYQRNAIRIEQADLPFDAEFAALSQDAVPFARSGVVVDFAVQPVRGALLRIVQESGTPVPAGARVRIDGQDRTFFVALDGETYVAGLSAKNRAVVSWRERACTLEIGLPVGDDPQPRLGTFVCRESAR